jgi:hypothetical protein
MLANLFIQRAASAGRFEPSAGFNQFRYSSQAEFAGMLVCPAANGFRIGLTLCGKNASRECLGRVSWQHGHALLHDDFAVIVLIIGEVDCATALGDAGSDNCLVNMMAVHPLAAKSGQQGRVDIEHSAPEIGGKFEQLQKAGEANEIGIPAMSEDGGAK